MSAFLTDTFSRRHTYLRISLTERCNLRCQYCMPADGVPLKPKADILTFEEIIRLAQIFAAGGVTKIRLTGGEPLVRKNLEELCSAISLIAGVKTLALTTNGLLLREKISALQSAGVNLINISLDTLRPERFQEITRRPGLDLVLDAIMSAIDHGYEPVKVNCVVMRGFNDDELTDFVAWTENNPVEVRFIEYMPFDGNQWNDGRFISYSEMVDAIAQVYTLERLIDGPNDTSKTFHVPGFRGRLGFITSMSEHFCSTCNRLRLTADGSLKVCLFGQAEVSLRDAMRAGLSDSEVEVLIGEAVRGKKASHAGMYEIAASSNRPMILIGG